MAEQTTWLTGRTLDQLDKIKDMIRDQAEAISDLQDGLERIETGQQTILSSLKTSGKSSVPWDIQALWATPLARLILSVIVWGIIVWGGGQMTLSEALKFVGR